MKCKSVIMIGGGIQEVEAVRIAQSMGLKVIVTDCNPDAYCFQYADYTAVIDGRDIESLIAFAILKKEEYNISGVFTLTELVTSVSAVASAAKLPGVSLQSAVVCQNKHLCKRKWKRDGIPTPEGDVINSYEEAKQLFNKMGGKVYIKPLVGFGGQGGGEICSLHDLKTFFRENGSLCKTFLIEELIRGTMHDVNGLITSDGVFHPLGIIDRKFLNNKPVEVELCTPTELRLKQQNDLYSLLDDGARSLGINFGPVKCDAVLTDSGFRIFEIAPRLHGPKNSLYLLPMSGFNPLVPTLYAITNSNILRDKININQDHYCLCKALLPNSGRILHLKGIEEAYQVNGIKHIMIFVKEGDVIHPYRNSTHVPGYVFAIGNTVEECNKIIKKSMSMIHFEFSVV